MDDVINMTALYVEKIEKYRHIEKIVFQTISRTCFQKNICEKYSISKFCQKPESMPNRGILNVTRLIKLEEQ